MTVVADEVVRPQFARARFWLVLAGLVGLGAVVLTLTTPAPGRALDPASAGHSGSLALARLLQARGTTVHRTTSLSDLGAATAVLVAEPEDYSAAQLRALAARHRLVVPASDFVVDTLASGLSAGPSDAEAGSSDPGCDDPAATAAGAVRFPAGTATYSGTPTHSVTPPQSGGSATTACYGGRVYLSSALAILGPSSLLTNADLADPGVAALDLNVISANGTVSDVAWLLPGADAQGEGSPSVWDLLPGWTPRAVAWLIVLGLLVTLWRSRRMGPVVYEPLPVVVRAAEIVEGHGRLYRRAHARAAAATALRQATRRRLARRHGLAPGFTLGELVAIATRTGWSPERLYSVLDGPAPSGDTELADLARALDALEHESGRSGDVSPSDVSPSDVSPSEISPNAPTDRKDAQR